MTADTNNELAVRTAEIIGEAFAAYHTEFKNITRSAKEHFERCEWHQMHENSERRLDLYKNVVGRAVVSVNSALGEQAKNGKLWARVKEQYSCLILDRHDLDIAQSFYNSVSMRIIDSGGIDPSIEYVGGDLIPSPPPVDALVYNIYRRQESTTALIRDILLDCRFAGDNPDVGPSAALAAEAIDSHLGKMGGGQQIESVEMANSVFYRGKGAYLVGRICTGSDYVPLVLALVNSESGIEIDAVLLTEDEVSIIFSFARSYFHVETDNPQALVHFLKMIMPLKPVSELFTSLGYNKHGKTELYRDLMRHMERSTDKFEIARGARGMVMVVFTLPSYDVVFKIIKDTFDYPKTATRKDVMNHYTLVFKLDRCGRLVDAQEFVHLRFAKERFSPDLLAELLSVAANTVEVQGDEVLIKHLYTERRLTPLDIYLKEVGEKEAVEAVVDYGRTIKELASTNIFPGDILLKNFGVTRHGRVVFYDYDELCLLTDCRFREMPEATNDDDEISGEAWFYVDDRDVFPEELRTFLGLPPHLREVFTKLNGDLFEVGFWAQLQARHEAGEAIDIFPYRESRRLSHNAA
ncbi:MAG: bifunctional isocitrate dehydrogenase kinase/phosphatase [Chloroflexia bacterium]